MTSPALEPPLWRHLTDAFHDSTLHRGQDYARRKHVSDLRVRQGASGTRYLEALVQGSESEPYRVTVTLGTGTPIRYAIDASCSCPVGYNCKHAAAAVIAHFDLAPERDSRAFSVAAAKRTPSARNRDAAIADFPVAPRGSARLLKALIERGLREGTPPSGRQDARPGTPPAAPAVATRLPPAHERWLAQLRALHAPPQPAVPRTHKLLLHVEVEPHDPRLRVKLMYGPLRKDGTLGALQAVNSDWFTVLRNPPRYVSEDDLPLLRRLYLATELLSTGRYLTTDAALLREFIEAGKVVVTPAAETRAAPAAAWPGGSGRPGYATFPVSFAAAGYSRANAAASATLRLGAARTSIGAWQTDTRGRQSFALQVQLAAQAFVLEGLWYLDAATAECGPLTADIDAAMAAILLRAPPVDTQEAPLVAHALEQSLAPLADTVRRPPKPGAMQLRRVSAPGVVHLHLANAEDGALARMHVAYGEVAVALEDSTALRAVNGELLAPAVDLKLHQKTLNRIASAGFEPEYPDPDDPAHESRFFLHESLVLRLMLENLPQWRKQGWVITQDADFAWQLVDSGPISIDTEMQPDNAWFSVDLGVDVDGQRIPLLPVLARLLADRDLRPWLTDPASRDSGSINVRIDERRIIALPHERVRTILQTLVELHQVDPDKPQPLRLARTDALRLHELARSGIAWRAPEPLRRLAERLAAFTAIEEVPPPAGLRAELRHYQRAGLSWLQFLREHELAGILADDMGLGKTVQAIAHVLTEKAAGRLTTPALVVAPTSVVHNWQMELARFAPELSSLVLQGPARAAVFGDIDRSDVVLSTYPLLPRDIEELEKHQFHLAIFDEAQNLKNPRSRAAESAARLRATHRVAMTGTPLENNLAELWSQFNVLMPGFLGDSRRFAQTYRTPIEKYGDATRRAHLARRVKPFILRRTKDMVLRELPPKTEIEHNVELLGAQRDLYETVRATMEKKVRDALAKRGLAQSHIVVLDALLKLRQVCCDPRLVASAAAKKVTSSAKLERLTELLPELIAEGRRVLLFSQFTSMLDLIEPVLGELQIAFVRLDGSTKDRKTPVARFQKGEVPLFLISLKAGGTGLNLTAADTVIHYDPWWNPAVENQATDRAHRIGQDKPVFVHRLIASGTVEERIRAMQARKADLARGILDENAALAKALSAEDFQALFEPLSA